MGHCLICEEKNDFWFNNKCEFCDKIIKLIKMVGSEKVAKKIQFRFGDEVNPPIIKQ